MRKLCISFLMALCFCAFTNKAMAWTGSGTQSAPWQISDGSSGGNNVTAYINGSTLYINGSGNMADFWNSTEGEAPWYSVRTNIQTVTIQSGVTNIGNRAFHDCSNLQTIIIPSSVTIIGRQAFYNCTSTNFTEITIPSTVNTIEGEAFWNCTSLKIVTIENGNNDLSFIRYRDGSYNYHYEWFKNCPIQTLHLGRDWTADANPFDGIQTLQTVTIGNTMKILGESVLANHNLLKTVTFQDGTNTLTLKTGYSYPSPFAGSPIETLSINRPLVISNTSYQPFAGKTTIKTVTFGNISTITSVPASLFENCAGLTSVTMPTSSAFTTIGASAFEGCIALPSINIPNSVTSIGGSAFYGCENLQSIIIPSSVTAIGYEAFENCTLLKTVTFQDGTNNLTLSTGYYPVPGGGRYAYTFDGPIETLYIGRPLIISSTSYQPFNKASIKTITFGNVSTITSVPASLFKNCTGLTSVTLPASTAFTTIGTNAFEGCTALPAINIPNTVTTINGSAFYGCENLQSIIIPSSVTAIGYEAFENCTLLKTVTFQDGTNNLTLSTGYYPVPGGGRYAYTFDGPIETLYIGRPLTISSSSYQPFNKTTIKTITIGSQVSSIGQNLFNGCTGLTSVTNNATTPQTINANVFGGVNISNIPLTVPAVSLTQYQATTVWKDFFTINGQHTAIEKIETSNFAVFPNPAKDEIFIQSEQPIEKVAILDIAGRIVETRHATSLQNGVQIINVSALPKGIYFAKIFVGNQIITKKVIKE